MPVGINPWLLPVGGFLGICVTAFVTWRISKRKNSGRVAFTEAEVLWGELRAELEYLRNRDQKQEERIKSLEQALEMSRRESIDSRVESVAARAESLQLRKEIAEFTKVVKVNGLNNG